jgi:hypothetical protein
LHLLRAGESWSLETSHPGGGQLNLTLCFEEEEVKEEEEGSESEPDNDIIISTSIDSERDMRITLSLVQRTTQCGEEEVMDPAKRMMGMLILGLGLGTVVSLLGYMVKNQLAVCADPRRNL